MTDAAVRTPVAVVTGSSRGIGRSIALRLAQDGWRLVLHARSSSRELATLQREIESLGSQARLLQADFGDADVNWRELVAEAFAGWNQVDAWIKKNTLERFGPVRSVTPHHVFEIAFEGIAFSKRHKSGVATRFPRILRWRKDKKIEEANSLEDLKSLIV